LTPLSPAGGAAPAPPASAAAVGVAIVRRIAPARIRRRADPGADTGSVRWRRTGIVPPAERAPTSAPARKNALFTPSRAFSARWGGTPLPRRGSAVRRRVPHGG